MARSLIAAIQNVTIHTVLCVLCCLACNEPYFAGASTLWLTCVCVPVKTSEELDRSVLVCRHFLASVVVEHVGP